MYVGRPRPPSSTEVTEVKDDGPIGCLMMLKCSEAEEGGVASVPVVRRVTMAEEEGIEDMCHVAMGDSGAMKETLVVVTTGGDVQILDVNSLQVRIRLIILLRVELYKLRRKEKTNWSSSLAFNRTCSKNNLRNVPFILQVVAVHTSAGGCGFTLCTAWSSSTGSWIAMATREGSVEVVRVCKVGAGGRGAEGEIQASLISQSKIRSLS